MTWFLVVLLHTVNCPGKCSDAPAVTIQIPQGQETCAAIKKANSDVPLECWAKP